MYVYIAEAHATDEWPIDSARFNGSRGPVRIAQTTTLERRQEAAAAFARDFAVLNPSLPSLQQQDKATIDGDDDDWISIMVDSPETGELFEKSFASWPIRFFVLQRATPSTSPSSESGSDRIIARFVSTPRDGGHIDLDTLRFALLRADLGTVKPLVLGGRR